MRRKIIKPKKYTYAIIRESKVEDYLGKRVKAHGGEVRKVKWIGRNSALDRRVMLPWINAWVELKRPGEDLTDAQAREHKRMRALGEIVVTLDSIEAVDEWLNETKMAHAQQQLFAEHH